MKQQKNKIVFVLVMVCMVLFITVYSLLTFGKDKKTELEPDRIPMPDLEENQKAYGSKMEALDAIKEEREPTAPQIYPDHMVDGKGYFNPDYLEYEKQHIIDSIYRLKTFNGERNPLQIKEEEPPSSRLEISSEDNDVGELEKLASPQELALEHQLFFASNPMENEILISENTDTFIYVRVDGTQTVRSNCRLEMRLTKEAIINGTSFPKNTPIYGFVGFKPNRTIIEIESINHRPVKLNAFDLQNGSEGIYIKNSFRAEARQEVVGDIMDDINIAGVPQVRGIKHMFRRNNRTVKVTVTDNYQLILKPIL